MHRSPVEKAKKKQTNKGRPLIHTIRRQMKINTKELKTYGKSTGEANGSSYIQINPWI